MKYDFLVFDLDGTLIDSQKDLASAVNLTRKNYGLAPLSTGEIKSFVGNGVTVLVANAVSERKGETLEEAVRRFNNYYASCLLDETKPYDGVEDMLETLKDIPKAVLSNKPELFSKEIIKRLGWQKHFIEVFGGDSVKGAKKPDPLVWFELIKKTNFNPKKSIMIGDGINDVKIAKAAKVDSLSVFYGFSSKEAVESFKSDFTAQTPQDIVDIVLGK
ncbi:MAG: HAD-IA family hydrolase [Elusimicrobiota bacterium]|jgi:phosphoglycolate phosphatase|nr:HAD-IA family hydrolase [Elusimicrobiota bacterium]